MPQVSGARCLVSYSKTETAGRLRFTFVAAITRTQNRIYVAFVAPTYLKMVPPVSKDVASLGPEEIAYTNGPVLMAVTGSFYAVALLTVLLRVYSRWFIVKSFGKDDCTMIAATVSVFNAIGKVVCQECVTRFALLLALHPMYVKCFLESANMLLSCKPTRMLIDRSSEHVFSTWSL